MEDAGLERKEMDSRQMAEAVGVSVGTLLRWLIKGLLVAEKRNGKWVFVDDQIEVAKTLCERKLKPDFPAETQIEAKSVVDTTADDIQQGDDHTLTDNIALHDKIGDLLNDSDDYKGETHLNYFRRRLT